jgi:hypothetical protein
VRLVKLTDLEMAADCERPQAVNQRDCVSALGPQLTSQVQVHDQLLALDEESLHEEL